MELSADFVLASARRLPHLPEAHPCHRLHGHTFHVTVFVRGAIDAHSGWVIDYADMAAAWEPVRQLLDHRYLNDVRGLDNPTSELIAVWIWKAINPALPQLTAIEIRETGGFRCRYTGPDK